MKNPQPLTSYVFLVAAGLTMYVANTTSLFAQPAVPGTTEQPSDSSKPEKKGNTPPSATNFTSVGTDGVSPRVLMSGDEARFGFDYDDADGDPCKRCELWIDLNQDGVYQDNEKMPMIDTNPDSKHGDGSYHHYELRLRVKNTKSNPKISFRFYAFDGKDEAENNGFYTKKRHVVVRVPVLSVSHTEKVVTVAGGRVEFSLKALIHYLYREEYVVDWDDFEHSINAMSNKNFILVDRRMERGYHSAKYDHQSAHLTVDVPGNVNAGSPLTLELPPLKYSRRGQPWDVYFLHFDPVTFSVKPFVLKGPDVSRTGIVVGDSIEYRFSLLVGTPHVQSGELSVEISRLTLEPFDITERAQRVINYPKGAQKKFYTLTMKYFGAPGIVTVPELRLGALKFSEQKVSVFSVNPPPKRPKNIDQYMSMVKNMRNEAVQEALPKKQHGLSAWLWMFYIATACVIGVLLLVYGGWKMLRTVVTTSKRRDHRVRIKEAKSAYDLARAQYEDRLANEELLNDELMTYAHSLRAYVLAIANTEDIPGFSANKLINERSVVSVLYRERLNKKAHFLDTETRARFRKIIAHPDLTTLVSADLLEELRVVEEQFFARSGG